MMMITAWSKVVPDGGAAYAGLAKFAVARMPKLIVKRIMEKERIRAAPLFGRCKTLAFHPPSLGCNISKAGPQQPRSDYLRTHTQNSCTNECVLGNSIP
jgi:hypothetical protein